MGDVFYSLPERNMERAARRITDEWYLGVDVHITGRKEGQGLRVKLEQNQAVILFEHRVQFYRGLGYIREWISAGVSGGEVEEMAAFEHLTYMIDCSRNAVARGEWLEGLICRLALMGYDRLMLYTEDTYEIEGQPFFGYLRGRYSGQELERLDAFAAEYGIELVPCIQTLAHLNAIFRWDQYSPVRDTGDILCCGLEETYELIEAMVQTMARHIKSRVINIGMDEAEMIGRGKYVKHFGFEERFDIMEKHLARVVAICQKYGYTCMMWSDMFFKMLNDDRYHDQNLSISEDVRKRIPEGVELIYWDYYSRDPQKYELMFKQHKQLAKQVGFAGGAWKWNGFVPLLNHSMLASGIALEKALEHGIRNMIVTGWGDDGGETAQAVVLPVLSLYAEFNYHRECSDEWLKGRLMACADADLDDFLRLDCLNLTPDNPVPGRVAVSPARYVLYQDVLSGIYDRHIDSQTYPSYFKGCAVELERIGTKHGPYQYVFQTLAALAKVLAVKSDMGIRLKKAYDVKDLVSMKAIAGQCSELILLLDQFNEQFVSQWLRENKPFGLEVADIRLGGLKQRVYRTKQRLEDYLNHQVEVLEELEADRLLLSDRENQGYETLPHWDNEWKKMVTAGVI